MDSMYYIGLDVHKKTISYCIKNVSGQVQREGTIGSTRGPGAGFSASYCPRGITLKQSPCSWALPSGLPSLHCLTSGRS